MHASDVQAACILQLAHSNAAAYFGVSAALTAAAVGGFYALDLLPYWRHQLRARPALENPVAACMRGAAANRARYRQGGRARTAAAAG